jgi:hypothetical protein
VITAGVFSDRLILSSMVVGIVLFAGWKGGELLFRHRVAVFVGPRARGQP